MIVIQQHVINRKGQTKTMFGSGIAQKIYKFGYFPCLKIVTET